MDQIPRFVKVYFKVTLLKAEYDFSANSIKLKLVVIYEDVRTKTIE